MCMNEAVNEDNGSIWGPVLQSGVQPEVWISYLSNSMDYLDADTYTGTTGYFRELNQEERKKKKKEVKIF